MAKGRRQQIVSLLKTHTLMKINDLCSRLDASPATIRRDLSLLENAGLIVRINGGALLKEPAQPEKEQSETDPFLQHKKAIAEAAIAMVKPGDTIFIDSGSTNNEIADLLVSLPNISLVTNSIEIAYKFIRVKDVSVFVCGGTMGEVNPQASIVGPLAEKMISQFRANICFLGTSGCDRKHGITDPYLSAAKIKETMIENASKVVLVTDHSKFGKVHKAFVCSIDKIDHVITDRLVPEADLEFLRSKNIPVTLV